VIAAGTRSHKVIPVGFTPKSAWNDMVNRQAVGFSTAILAYVIISMEDFFSRELNPGVGTFNHPGQPDDRWQGKGLRY